jgi:dolichol-phosphate mannosyltransferase
MNSNKIKEHAIVIPTYNERGNLKMLTQRIFAAVPGVSLFIVDDNSPDGTAELVKKLAQEKYPELHLIRREKKDGLGRAYIYGFGKVLADPSFRTVTMMDGDLSHEPERLPAMLAASETYSLVIGSRYTVGGGVTNNWSWWRRTLSFGANLYLRLIFRINIKDWTTGYNTINTELLRRIDFTKLDLNGYAFISSLKYYLLRNGARVKEIPIFFEERAAGVSKMSGSIIMEGVLAPWKIIFRKRS